MKTKLTLIALVIVSLTTFAFTGCDSAYAAVSENRIVHENFYGLILQTNARVILNQGTETSVRVEGDETSVASVQTTVENGALVIKSKDEVFATIYVTVDDINLIEVNGNGKIISNQPINSDMLLLKVVGSGSINIDVRSLSLGMIVKGSGKIYAKGSTVDSYVRVYGSGRVNSIDLDSLKKLTEANNETLDSKKPGKHSPLKLHR